MQTNSEKERNSNFIEEKFNKIGLEKLSRESEFSKRKSRKIKAKDFLLGFFMMSSSREKQSYQNWAITIYTIYNEEF